MKQSALRSWIWAIIAIMVVVIAGYWGWEYFKKDLANPRSNVVKREAR